MTIHLVQAVLESPTEQTIRALLDDRATVFWIDWREEDDSIVAACEDLLQTGGLCAEFAEADNEEEEELTIQYGDRRVRVPLTYSEADRHITLCALNEALAPDYEVRFCIDSNGGDTLAFLPLSTAQWADLERQYGNAVQQRFYAIAAQPNLFTDSLPF
jgi:hypothetical protein